MSNLDILQQTIAYQFQELRLLETALTHRSARGRHNERLEFLGDSIVNFLIADMLYRRYPAMREGNLSRLRASLVSGERMAELARSLQIGQYLHLGAGEQRSGGQQRESILADAMEALIGAIYLDSDMQTCGRVVLTWFAKHLQDLSELKPRKDAKSQLQEWAQARQLPLPYYVATATGEAHQQTFHVQCTIKGMLHETQGRSSSRRKAEQMAAQAYLKLIEKE